MPNTPKAERPFQEEIIGYLEGKLSDDQRYSVEQRWLRDPDTRAAVDGLRNSGLSAQELKHDFAQIRRRRQENTLGEPASHPRRASWIVAAVIILLGCWSASGYYQDQQPSRLYAEYFANSTAQENYLAVRGTEAEKVTGLNAALAAYEQRDFVNSYLQFQALRENHPFNSTVLRYTALSAMQIGEFYVAEQALQQNLTIATSTQARAAATWYLALTYLQLEEAPKTVQLLDTLIVTQSGQYYEQAVQLLKQIQDK